VTRGWIKGIGGFVGQAQIRLYWALLVLRKTLHGVHGALSDRGTIVTRCLHFLGTTDGGGRSQTVHRQQSTSIRPRDDQIAHGSDVDK
jgi:hypothetical protein